MNGLDIMENDTVQKRVQMISQQDDITLNMSPTSAKVEISGICTLQCNFCFQQQMRKQNRRQKLMPMADFEKVVNYLQSIDSLKEVGLFLMGESALNSNLCTYYKMLKDNSYFTFLTTNGTKIDTVLQAIPYVDSLKISWNYVDERDFIAKTNASPRIFEMIRQNICTLYDAVHENGKELAVSTVLDRPKEDYMPALAALKYDQHYWIPLQTQCGYNSYGIDGVVGEDSHRRKPMPCWSLFKSVYIDVDLNVRTCCYGHYDKHILYNLNDVPHFKFTDVYTEMRTLQLDGKIPFQCKECLRSL